MIERLYIGLIKMIASKQTRKKNTFRIIIITKTMMMMMMTTKTKMLVAAYDDDDDEVKIVYKTNKQRADWARKTGKELIVNSHYHY